MKFKKIMLVTFVLLAILTIGAVSAADDIITNETLAADNVEEVSADASVDGLISESGDEVIAASEDDVQSLSTSIDMDVEDVYEGETIFFEFYVKEFNDSGTVNLSFNGNTYEAGINGGGYGWIKLYGNVEPGIYQATAVHYPSGASVNKTVEILPKETNNDDFNEENEGDDEGILYIDEGNILVGEDREVVGLNTEKEMDVGRLVVFDTDTNEIYFDDNLSNMEYNTNWMKYKFNAYNGYYLFPNNLNVPSSGVYNINATYYNDDGTINETVTGTVIIDIDSYINTEEIDINDDEAILVNVYVLDRFEDGAIVIGYYDNDHVQPLLKKSINAEDINTALSFKVSDLELDVGNYEGFYVGHLLDGCDEWNDEDIYFIISDTYLSVVDNTVFRAFIDEGIASIFSKEDLFQVYCPISSANTNMTIKVNDNEVITHLITESEAGGYIGFNLSELGIDELGEYSFDIYDDNGECLLDDYYYEFGNPFEFSEYCINGTDDDFIVEFRVPEGLNQGTIRLTDADDNQLFSSDLSDMDYQSLGWDKGFIRYVVVFDDLNGEFEAGVYTFYAEYIGEINVNNAGDVRIIERKYAENENASIDIFDYNIYDVGNINEEEPESIAEVRANNDEGYVNVIIGDGTVSLIDPSDDDDGIFIYRVTVDKFEEVDEGVYPIEVIYYNGDGDQVLNLSSMITFIRGSVDVYVESYEIVMGDGWNDSKFIDLKVFKDFRGSILVKLDDEEYIVQSSDLASYPDDNMDIFVHYSVTFNDLNKTDYEESEYDLFIQVFEDENDWPIWSYDDSDQISFYKQQIAWNNYVTIEIDPTSKTVPYGQFIYITSNDDSDNVTIYIDDSEDPISIRLSECAYDDELERFVIGCEDLNLGAGDYNLNVTYGSVSLIGQVSLVPNLNIIMPGDDEIIYNGYDQDPNVIAFNLRDGNIYVDPISGNVTVLIYLDGENPTVCFEADIADIDWDGRIQSKAIRLSQLDGCSDLNGAYKVEVRYENGTEASTGAECNVVFKTLDADDFAVETSDDKIIFTNIPEGVWGIIEVTADDESKAVELWVIECDNEEYNYIKIRGLSSASHVSVVFKGDEESDDALELLNVVNQIDPALSITVADITYGDAAIVTVTTNETFSGNVLVQIGDSNYSVAVTKGKGNIPISGLAAGDYVVKAFFKATEIFGADEKNTTFTVNKMETTVSPLNYKLVTTFYTKGTLIICLKDANGNPLVGKNVTAVFGKYAYEGVTNAKGRIYVTTVKSLPVGKYYPTLTFAGDENYTDSTGTAKIVVCKATPKFTYTAKVTYKRSNAKKYTIKLKTDLGVKMKNAYVVLKVNNVKYKGFTNSKGLFTFNLKKLTKKGNYIGRLYFYGDSKYNAINYKVKIYVR